MVDRRSRRGDSAKHSAKRSRRGFVTVQLPRHVIPKQLAGGKMAYCYNVPTKYRKLKCSVENEPLGTDFSEMTKGASALNGQFDEWDTQRKGAPGQRAQTAQVRHGRLVVSRIQNQQGLSR